MRVRVPPRSIAAGIRLRAATRAGWALAAIMIVEQAIVTIEYFNNHGNPAQLGIPLLALGLPAAALAILAFVPSRVTAIAYVIVGAGGISAYAWELLRLDMPLENLTLVGSLGAAVVLTGAASGSPLRAAAGTLAASIVVQAALISTQIAAGVAVRPDSYALLIGGIYFITYLLMGWSDRVQTAMVDTQPLEDEIAREEVERQQERRAATLVHDTVLRDLALIAHGHLVLADHERERLRRDLDEIRALRAPDGERMPQPQVRADFYTIIREFQWRGLTVDVGGSSYLIDLLDGGDREALLGATAAALDNVLAHSGRTNAEVFIDHGGDTLTVMVVDDGYGFNPDAVADDRLGLRMAIVRRMEDQGGSVSVWSSPRSGTSVVMSIPLPETAGSTA